MAKKVPCQKCNSEGRIPSTLPHVREFLEEFLRIRPAMPVVEKAGCGKTEGFGLTGFIPYLYFGSM